MTHSEATRFSNDALVLRELWRTLFDTSISVTQIDYWLDKYGAAATIFAIRKTFTVFVKEGKKSDEADHKERYCATVARNESAKRSQVYSEVTLRKHASLNLKAESAVAQ